MYVYVCIYVHENCYSSLVSAVLVSLHVCTCIHVRVHEFRCSCMNIYTYTYTCIHPILSPYIPAAPPERLAWIQPSPCSSPAPLTTWTHKDHGSCPLSRSSSARLLTTPTARYPIDRLPWTCHASILVRTVPPGISLMCPTHTLSHRFPSAYLPSPAGISRLFHAAPQHRHRRGHKNIKVHALHRTKARHVRCHTWIMLFNRSQAVTITALASIPALPGIL